MTLFTTSLQADQKTGQSISTIITSTPLILPVDWEEPELMHTIKLPIKTFKMGSKAMFERIMSGKKRKIQYLIDSTVSLLPEPIVPLRCTTMDVDTLKTCMSA